MTNKDKCFLAYVAGLIDGEGCINIISTQRKLEYSNYDNHRVESYLSYRASVMINMTDALALAILKEHFPSSHFYSYPSKQENRKRIFMWCLYDNHCFDFLRDISPFLINKRDEAKLLLSFLATKRRANVHKKYDASYWKRLSGLHQKLMAIRQSELNVVKSVELLNRLDLRQYRAKHEDCERLREGVTTTLNKYKATSTAEKEIV